MIEYWNDDYAKTVLWDDVILYGKNHSSKYFVVSHDRFSYEDSLYARCDTYEEATLVVQMLEDIKKAEGQQYNPIANSYSIMWPKAAQDKRREELREIQNNVTRRR
jgi:hypothetical protein